MGHPAIDNQTPFAFTPSFATDEEGRPLLVPLLQATYTIVPQFPLELAEEQDPPSLAGELWGDDAATSSYQIEPTYAFTKLATDVALVGHAQMPGRETTEVLVGLAVGPLTKTVRVVGDRVWVTKESTSAPLPFERLPLKYERAFGGRDAAFDTVEPQNPVGMGYRDPRNVVFAEGVRIPNIQHPSQPQMRFGQQVPVAGLGFVSPDWQPRLGFAGTYDDAWSKNRSPLLPKDFDRRFFTAGAAGLVTQGYLQGNEPVVVQGASPHGSLSFNLPGYPPPRCRVQLVHQRDVDVTFNLDTLVIDTDRDRVLLLYRGFTPLRDGLHDVKAIEITAPQPQPAQNRAARGAWA